MTLGKSNVMLIVEVRPEGSVPKDNPPMINVLTRAQDSLGCIPIDLNGKTIFKGFSLN
jgi:hypothetical protein